MDKKIFDGGKSLIDSDVYDRLVIRVDLRMGSVRARARITSDEILLKRVFGHLLHSQFIFHGYGATLSRVFSSNFFLSP